MQIFTVFCIDLDRRHDTTHVSSHEARDIEEAKQLAVAEAAANWAQHVNEIGVRGVAAGDVDILEWDDEV